MRRRFIVFALIAAVCFVLPAAAQISATLQSAATGNGNGAVLRVYGMATATLTVNCSGCSGGTQVNFQASQDGSHYVSIAGAQAGTTVPTYATSTTTSGVTVWQFAVAGYQTMQATISNYSAGTITVTATVVNVTLQQVKPPPGFFVATTGSDTQTGSFFHPFATLARCQTAMQGSATKTCYVRGGVYALTASISLTSADFGETWSYFPPDGLGAPTLTQSSAFAYFLLNDQANNITITGFSATGFQHTATTSCNNTPQASFVLGPTATSGATNNLTVTYNSLSTFDCGIFPENATNPTVSNNTVDTVEYVAIGCYGCTGAATQSVWQGNIISNVDPDQHGSNGYGITMVPNTTTNYVSRNFTLRQNAVYNSPNWECFDNHAGENIWWIDNLCVGAGANTAYNAAALSSALPLSNIIQANNIYDIGNFSGSLFDSFVQCGYNLPCSTNSAGITGGELSNNFVLNNSASCVIASAPPVTVNNPASPYCATIPPETVSSVDFGGFTTYGFAASQPNAVVATLVAHTSSGYWDFPMEEPATLAIGGINSGGFVVCNDNQICQPAGGTSAGTYNDFSIIATLPGMSGSPVTVSAGTLTLTSGGAFFVATTGSDSNAGTLASPFATLHKCQTAMQGSSTKTCILRSGTYTPSSVGVCAPTGSDTTALNLGSADVGETWTYYPPDGYNSALINGQNTAGGSSGLAYIVCSDGNAGVVTFNGLAFENVYKDFIYGFTALVITNDTFIGQSFVNFPNDNGCLLFNTSAGGPTISHNIFQNCWDRGIDIEAIANGGINNTIIAYNYFQNVCSHNGDCGALYISNSTFAPPNGVAIYNNFVRDVNLTHNQPGSGDNVGFCFYEDGAAVVGLTFTGNVCTGNVGYANPTGGGGNACFFINGGTGNTFTGNICSLANTSMEIANFQNTSGTNFWSHNIIVASQAQNAGTGYAGNVTNAISGNQYYNYNTSFGVVTSGGGGSDSNPVLGNPLIHCWGALLAKTSPAYISPVSFLPQPTAWDTAGFWGPPGFTMLQTGTSPVWPTTSGDGVTCTGSN